MLLRTASRPSVTVSGSVSETLQENGKVATRTREQHAHRLRRGAEYLCDLRSRQFMLPAQRHGDAPPFRESRDGMRERLVQLPNFDGHLRIRRRRAHRDLSFIAVRWVPNRRRSHSGIDALAQSPIDARVANVV